MDLLTMKSKGGRKISLPWFRQTSVQQTHAALSRQHTIDTPGSFRSYVGSKKLQVNLSHTHTIDVINVQSYVFNYHFVVIIVVIFVAVVISTSL
jgi:hypothetical protein